MKKELVSALVKYNESIDKANELDPLDANIWAIKSYARMNQRKHSE
jgi:hypothetical protein